MIWIVALCCLGLVGLAGYHRGPVCAGFSLLGLLVGVWLVKPIAPIASHLVPLLGLKNPLWGLYLPQGIVFLVILVIFKIAGYTLHQKLTLHYKYQKDERVFFRWERLYHRLGLCVGLLNGTVYFFLLMMPVYLAGYFTTEAAGADAPGGLGVVNRLRAELHASSLDRVLAAHDPIPPQVYQASDIIDLVLRNPLLESRLAHYPPILTLAGQPEILAIANDVQLQQMIQSQAKIGDILAQPKIQALLTNAAITAQIRGLIGGDLGDLQQYLDTGASPKYDGTKILGIWAIDVRASLAEEKKRNPNMQGRQLAALQTNFIPMITGLSILARTDNQFLLRKQNPNNAESPVVGQGTWQESGGDYEISLPDNKPDTVEVTPGPDGTLQFPRGGHVLIFNKEQ